MENYHINWGISVDADNPRSTMRKAMRLSIILLERLIDRDGMIHAKHAWSAHDQKWGEVELNFEELPNGNSRVITNRPNVTKDNVKQEQEEYKQLLELNQKIYERDKKWLYNILCKYGDTFWD